MTFPPCPLGVRDTKAWHATLWLEFGWLCYVFSESRQQFSFSLTGGREVSVLSLFKWSLGAPYWRWTLQNRVYKTTCLDPSASDCADCTARFVFHPNCGIKTSLGLWVAFFFFFFNAKLFIFKEKKLHSWAPFRNLFSHVDLGTGDGFAKCTSRIMLPPSHCTMRFFGFFKYWIAELVNRFHKGDFSGFCRAYTRSANCET